jgi:ABC-type glycerol-3-phosphate transport system permease component
MTSAPSELTVSRAAPGAAVTTVLSESAPAVRMGPPRRRRRTRRGAPQWIVCLALSLIAFVGLFPFLFMFLASFKTNKQFYSSYWMPDLPLHWGNYSVAWRQVEPYFLTTVIVAALAVVATLVLSAAAGFVLARMDFLGRKFLFVFISMLLMVPSIAGLVPMFVMMKDFDLLNTRIVLALPQVAGNTVLGIVLIKTFAESLPQELFDAARVDGAGGFRLFVHVMLPLSLPVLGTVALTTCINVWNDFFWPLLTITDDKLRTVSAGLSFFQGQNITQWGPLFAGYTLASLPLLALFVFLSKYFLAGIQGGVTGASK